MIGYKWELDCREMWGEGYHPGGWRNREVGMVRRPLDLG